MSRIEPLALALAVTGCMRIYPDPELPDVKVEWYPELDCMADSDRVAVSITAGEPAVEVATATAPCADGSLRIVNVARERYHVTAQIEDEAGGMLGYYEEDIDLRDGLSERVSAFFGRGFDTLVHAAWTFDAGASCDSLEATQVSLWFAMPGQAPYVFAGESCAAGMTFQSVPVQGTYTVSARALGPRGFVAVSPETPPVELSPRLVVDLGTFVLSPCGDACPQGL